MRKDDPRIDLARTRSMGEVVSRLGLGTGLERGEITGPCPSCGGRDRFSVNPSKGVFRCRKCKPAGGDPIALVMLVMACDFRGAIEYLEGTEEIEIDPAEIARRAARAKRDQERRDRAAAAYRAKRIEEARDIWRTSIPFREAPIACNYFRLRGIDLAALECRFACLRFHPAHPYEKVINKRTYRVHVGPALIAAVQGPDGRFSAVHQTWLDLEAPKGKALIHHPITGEPLASKMVHGSQKGGAIRLTGNACASTLVMGEGIETTATALVARAVPGASYWAGISLGNMAGKHTPAGEPKEDERAFLPPPHVDRMIPIQDGDSAPKPTRAALEAMLRRAMLQRPDLRGAIVHPGAGFDLNDLIKR